MARAEFCLNADFVDSGMYTWKCPLRSHTNGTRIKDIWAGYVGLGALA